jgi:hypothetical protein
MGRCPCPRCTIRKEDISKLGQLTDMSHRKSHARKDDTERRRKVQTARDIIYEKRYTVQSKAVERILSENSLVPTLVCSACWHKLYIRPNSL